MSAHGRDEERDVSRRELLRIGTGVGLGIAGASLLVLARDLRPPASTAPATAPIAKGDVLVLAEGKDQGSIITPERVPAGGPQVLAWPMDPGTKVVKSQRSLNIVLLVRAETGSWYSGAEQARTSAGIAAYSATCTHLCCGVSDWVRDGGAHGALLCPCHKSSFDPWDGGRVLAGPAPRPLPVLPITVAGDRIVVAGTFLANPGCRG